MNNVARFEFGRRSLVSGYNPFQWRVASDMKMLSGEPINHWPLQVLSNSALSIAPKHYAVCPTHACGKDKTTYLVTRPGLGFSKFALWFQTWSTSETANTSSVCASTAYFGVQSFPIQVIIVFLKEPYKVPVEGHSFW